MTYRTLVCPFCLLGLEYSDSISASGLTCASSNVSATVCFQIESHGDFSVATRFSLNGDIGAGIRFFDGLVRLCLHSNAHGSASVAMRERARAGQRASVNEIDP